MGQKQRSLLNDERAIEGLPIRLVIALVVGVAALALMMGILGGIGQFNKTELDVYHVAPGGDLENTGDPTVLDYSPDRDNAHNNLDFLVYDENGDPVDDATIVITDGTAKLESVIRASTGTNSNRVQISLHEADLKRGQSKGTLQVEVVPPADSNYVDKKKNPEVLVLEQN